MTNSLLTNGEVLKFTAIQLVTVQKISIVETIESEPQAPWELGIDQISTITEK